MRKTFFAMSNGMNNEEVTCIEVASILRKLSEVGWFVTRV